jgi:hypothetical protein
MVVRNKWHVHGRCMLPGTAPLSLRQHRWQAQLRSPLSINTVTTRVLKARPNWTFWSCASGYADSTGKHALQLDDRGLTVLEVTLSGISVAASLPVTFPPPFPTSDLPVPSRAKRGKKAPRHQSGGRRDKDKYLDLQGCQEPKYPSSPEGDAQTPANHRASVRFLDLRGDFRLVATVRMVHPPISHK